jgi:hypothetical protein
MQLYRMFLQTVLTHKMKEKMTILPIKIDKLLLKSGDVISCLGTWNLEINSKEDMLLQ